MPSCQDRTAAAPGQHASIPQRQPMLHDPCNLQESSLLAGDETCCSKMNLD